jgi:DNA-binding IclR family transcriptional regulator
VTAVAAPVFSASGEAVAALGVSGIDAPARDGLAARVMGLARELTAALARSHA